MYPSIESIGELCILRTRDLQYFADGKQLKMRKKMAIEVHQDGDGAWNCYELSLHNVNNLEALYLIVEYR